MLFIISSKVVLNFDSEFMLCLPYTDALVYSAECLKYKQPGILNKVI